MFLKIKNIYHAGYDDIASNTIFSATKQANNNRSASELKELDKKIDSITNTKIKVNYDESLFKNKVYFKDANSGEFIKIGLSDENLAKLKSTFGADDFYSRDNGSVILSGNAENFVAGWFGDIAYQRGYLNADSDGNGAMSSDELANTNSGFMANSSFNVCENLITSNSTSSYLKYDKEFRALHEGMSAKGKYASDSIEAELNKTLSNDKNSDGILEYQEIILESEHNSDTEEVIEKTFSRKKADWGEEVNLLEESPEQKALKQLLISGESSLSAKQKALLAKAGLLKDDSNLGSVIQNISANIANSKTDLKA